MTQPADEQLLDWFRQWLEATRAGEAAAAVNGSASTALDAATEPDADPGEVGIYRLVEEFTALRHEVKLQTRSGRGLEEEAAKLLAALRQALDALRAIEPRETQAAWSAGKGLALALADLDEALDRGREQLEKARESLLARPVEQLLAKIDEAYARQSWLGRWLTRNHHEQARELIRQSAEQPEERTRFEGLLDGYALIKQRLTRALAAEGVVRIAALGEPVDPERMIVLEVVPATGRRGVVVQEIRRGYTWQGRILRCAEVSASSLDSP